MIRYYLRYLPRSHDNAFKPLDMIKGNININDYVPVYQGEIDASKSLEETNEILFTKFNIDHPEGFAAHSMSIGDIIEYRDFDKKTSTFYFCDSVGFQNIDDKIVK